MNKKLKRMVDRTLVYYMIIGILNFILCTAIMYLLFNVCGFSDRVAPVCNHALGSLIWFVACRYILFRGRQSRWQLILRFLIEVIVCHLISYYLIAPLLTRVLLPNPRVQEFFSFGGKEYDKIRGNCEITVGTAAYAILNYFGQRYFVFSGRYELRRKQRAAGENDLPAEENCPENEE